MKTKVVLILIMIVVLIVLSLGAMVFVGGYGAEAEVSWEEIDAGIAAEQARILGSVEIIASTIDTEMKEMALEFIKKVCQDLYNQGYRPDPNAPEDEIRFLDPPEPNEPTQPPYKFQRVP